MNVLLLGAGGREHALARALKPSPLLTRLVVGPGNPGIAEIARCAPLDLGDHGAVLALCAEEAIDFVVVGPEAPLVAGLVDDLAAAGVKAFGPNRAGAQLEGSKGFTKDLCAEFGVPTAAYARFNNLAAAQAYLAGREAPIVVKADGLAAGKGVTVAATIAEAQAAVAAAFGGAFGPAGAEVVIEDFLEGEEASFFALCDGTRAIPFASAQDHKRVGEGDRGANTGGMGAYSPAPIMTQAMSARVMRDIIEPTMAGMRARGAPFKGVLFAGLMIGRDGPMLIEYNTRFGDPETQVMLPRLDEDLLPLLIACAAGKLRDAPVRLKAEAALTVVLAAKGYPENPHKGGVIRGIAVAAALPGVSICHAGTALRDGAVVAAGGRVLNVTGIGPDVHAAQACAYAGVAAIDFPDGFFRRDIGWRALASLPQGAG